MRLLSLGSAKLPLLELSQDNPCTAIPLPWDASNKAALLEATPAGGALITCVSLDALLTLTRRGSAAPEELDLGLCVELGFGDTLTILPASGAAESGAVQHRYLVCALKQAPRQASTSLQRPTQQPACPGPCASERRAGRCEE